MFLFVSGSVSVQRLPPIPPSICLSLRRGMVIHSPHMQILAVRLGRPWERIKASGPGCPFYLTSSLTIQPPRNTTPPPTLLFNPSSTPHPSLFCPLGKYPIWRVELWRGGREIQIKTHLISAHLCHDLHLKYWIVLCVLWLYLNEVISWHICLYLIVILEPDGKCGGDRGTWVQQKSGQVES